jgi:hypothetical protein
MWALRYDDTAKRVVANQPIRDRGIAVLSFGEDERGEVYFLSTTLGSAGIHWFVRQKDGPKKTE